VCKEGALTLVAMLNTPDACPNLKELNLARNPVGKRGVDFLSSPSFSSLSKLNLNCKWFFSYI
jgi:hypothetical protein